MYNIQSLTVSELLSDLHNGKILLSDQNCSNLAIALQKMQNNEVLTFSITYLGDIPVLLDGGIVNGLHLFRKGVLSTLRNGIATSYNELPSLEKKAFNEYPVLLVSQKDENRHLKFIDKEGETNE